MKSTHFVSSVGFCIFLLLAEVAFAQQGPQWPYRGYGGELVGEDSLTFKGWAPFIGATFDSLAYFTGATFDDEAHFRMVTFKNVATFSGATFDYEAYFYGATFDYMAYFTGATFDDEAHFRKAVFHSKADFFKAKFARVANFNSAKFDSVAYFKGAEFYDQADFSGATFDDWADFSGAAFDSVVDFVQARFGGTVSFTNTDFSQGIDFRQAYFDSVQTLYLEKMTFPERKLLFYWHQFQGKDSLRIKLQSPPVDSLKQVHYNRIGIIYHRLRDNFLDQQDKASADAVMYELGWQKKEILGEFWWKMYGFFFGYGFQPWRFLLFVVLPIVILFAGTWYWFYYGMLIFIHAELYPKMTTDNQLAAKEKYIFRFKNLKLIKVRFNDFSSIKGDINRLTRYWHALFFSAAVLFGIRFKKEWSKVCPDNILGSKTFIYCVTLEWLLGIGLVVTFALLVKGARFGFIKDLLGF